MLKTESNCSFAFRSSVSWIDFNSSEALPSWKSSIQNFKVCITVLFIAATYSDISLLFLQHAVDNILVFFPKVESFLLQPGRFLQPFLYQSHKRRLCLTLLQGLDCFWIVTKCFAIVLLIVPDTVLLRENKLVVYKIRKWSNGTFTSKNKGSEESKVYKRFPEPYSPLWRQVCFRSNEIADFESRCREPGSSGKQRNLTESWSPRLEYGPPGATENKRSFLRVKVYFLTVFCCRIF